MPWVTKRSKTCKKKKESKTRFGFISKSLKWFALKSKRKKEKMNLRSEEKRTKWNMRLAGLGKSHEPALT